MRRVLSIVIVFAVACGVPRPPVRGAPDPDDPSRHAGIASSEVRLTGFEVLEGALDVDQARLSLAARRGDVQSCLAGTTLRVHGQLAVRLRVGSDGAVERTEAENAEGIDPDVVFCVLRALRTASFPASGATADVRVTLGFVDPDGAQLEQ